MSGGSCGLTVAPPSKKIDLNRRDSNKGSMGNHRSSNHKDSNFINRAGQKFRLGGIVPIPDRSPRKLIEGEESSGSQEAFN